MPHAKCKSHHLKVNLLPRMCGTLPLGTRSRGGCTAGFFDEENDPFIGPLSGLDAVAGFLNQRRDVDRRKGVGAVHLPLGHFVQTFLGAGLQLESFEEPGDRDYPVPVALSLRG